MKAIHSTSARVLLVVLMGVTLQTAGKTTFAQSWHNSADPNDVSGDGQNFYNDFHILISELEFPQVTANGGLPAVANPPPFFDVTDDGRLSQVDLVTLVNAQVIQPGVPDGAIAISGPAAVEFEFQDATGMPISQATTGESFFLVANVFNSQDAAIRPTSAYFDLLFDGALASVTSVDVGTGSQALPGTPSSTGLDEIGSVQNFEFSPAFVLEMQATAEGTLLADGANGFVTLIDRYEYVEPVFTTDSLTIVPEPAGLFGLLAGSIVLPGLRRRS